jgi:hypothetical protein
LVRIAKGGSICCEAKVSTLNFGPAGSQQAAQFFATTLGDMQLRSHLLDAGTATRGA